MEMDKLDRINIQAFIFTSKKKFRILILKRIPERSGYWQPVCGGIEEGEEPIEAVKREVFEETGLRNIKNIIDLQYDFIYKEPKNGKLMNMKDMCFALEVDDIFDVVLSDEHEKYKWCSKDEAKEYLKWEHNRVALEKLLTLKGEV
ncbi:NUDIX domain-containing protein [Haloimpatiens sp. FM7330]|uniref:NUDIX domain-containing protein n=1 Tax=Haloimpatiens sp. FM7330 TaxID=3298610 RepID=UPI003625BFBD